MDQIIRITWGLRDGRSITVRAEEATARNVAGLAEQLGAFWIQDPAGTGGRRTLYLRDGPVRSIRITPDQYS